MMNAVRLKEIMEEVKNMASDIRSHVYIIRKQEERRQKRDKLLFILAVIAINIAGSFMYTQYTRLNDVEDMVIEITDAHRNSEKNLQEYNRIVSTYFA